MTRTAFVIGHPIAHSRSPLIHGYWLKRYGIDGAYKSIDVAPEALAAFSADLRAGAYVGGNVTVPLKRDVLSLCDEVDDAARAIGAVNTLVMKDNRLFGSNTDWSGFLANLDGKAPGWDGAPGPVMVLGAGGAARAVITGLARRSFSPIRILNRTPKRAEALADELGADLTAKIEGHAIENFERFAPETGLVVNTSTIGMHGTRFDNLALALLPDTALVTDIVYVPLMTPLLADAAARGLKIVDGLGMLLHQAVPGFAAWFGIRPEVTEELRALVERDMGLLPP